MGPASASRSASRFFACTKACRSSLVPTPISGVEGPEGPHFEGFELGMLLIYMSDRDGFLGACAFVLFDIARPRSLPSLPKTEEARLCSEDHEESRKSAAPPDEDGFEDLFHPEDAVSWRVAREGWLIGRGDAAREDNGDGVAPRERVVANSDGARVDRPDENGCESSWEE